MPTLLQINATCNWGSTGHIAEQIAISAQKNGWTCYIAHGARYINKSLIKTYAVGPKIDNYFHAAFSMFLGKHGLGSYKATIRLVKFIKKIQPNVIHLHNIHGYYLNYPVLFKYLKESGIPVVWTFHDCWAMTGQCTHFVSVDCNKWKSNNGCSHCPLLGESYRTYVDRSSKNWRMKKECFSSLEKLTIVPVSYWLEEVVKESYFKGKHIYTIYNGVDTTQFVPMDETSFSVSKYGLKKNQYVLGVSTGWSEKKGYKDYCKLAAKMPVGIRIALLGLDKRKCHEVEKYGIVGIKRTDNVKELVELYNGAIAVTSLSYEETFGLTIVEGFSCGVPGIVYNVTASPELITPETGIVVEPGDLDGVLSAIQTICNKGKAYYSKACRDRAVTFFDKDKQYSKYIELYEMIK